MLKRLVLLSFLLATAILGFGCVESAMLVKVKPDGTGHVVCRMLMAEEMMSGVQMMATMSGEELAMPQGGMSSSNLIDGIMQGLAPQFGEGVLFQSGKQATNKKGWKGFEAIYAFEDVTRLKLADLDPLGGAGGGEGAPGANLGPKYRFAFTPGETAVLELIPTAPASPTPSTEGTDASPSPQAAIDQGPLGGMQGMMSGMMSGMMQKMLAGMRVSMVVSVDGEVVETNASHPAESHSNAFVLVDIPFDTILADPKAAALMTKPAPDPADLASLDLPGLKIEKPGKTIRVEFR